MCSGTLSVRLTKLKVAGELDAGSCSPIMVRKFSELINADQVQLIPDQGHQLTRAIVQSVVGRFLTQAG